MSGEATIVMADVFVVLLVALALLAMVSRRLAVPYTLALVLFGLLISLLAPRLDISVTPELILAIFVPGLIFDAAFRMDVAALRRNLPVVALLTVPGVVIVAGIVAVVLHLATGLDYQAAFLVGAMVSATDPVAVISTMRHMHAPERLANLVEAESLFNDGTGVVLFSIAVSGGDLLIHGTLTFLTVAIASAAIGLGAGLAVTWAAARTDDVNVELTLTLIAAYGTYLFAAGLGQSGIIATLVAGMVLGNYGARSGMSSRGRVAIDTVWSYLAFLLTALVFLVIGLTITPGELVNAAEPILWGVVAVILGRAIVVYGLIGGAGHSPLGRRLRLELPVGWLHVLFWSGLRGAIAVALALSLPQSMPDRQVLQSTVFGLVLFMLLVQGGTAGAVLRWAGAHATVAEASAAG